MSVLVPVVGEGVGSVHAVVTVTASASPMQARAARAGGRTGGPPRRRTRGRAALWSMSVAPSGVGLRLDDGGLVGRAELPGHRPGDGAGGLERLRPADLGEPAVLVVGGTAGDVRLAAVEVVVVLRVHGHRHGHGGPDDGDRARGGLLVPADGLLPVLGNRVRARG